MDLPLQSLVKVQQLLSCVFFGFAFFLIVLTSRIISNHWSLWDQF
jgi:hypothetical protein